MAYLIDRQTGESIGRVFPQHKTKNAEGERRSLKPVWVRGEENEPDVSTTETIPPLLRKLLSDYAATGWPPAYIAKTPNQPTDESTLFNDEHLF